VYNDVTDNTGKVVKTAGEVHAAVRDLLRRLGTSTGFADHIAAEYAAQGRDGDGLPARLLNETASLPAPVPMAGPKPATATMDAAAQVVDAQHDLFSMRDTTMPGIDIMGEVRGGELAFMVRGVLHGTGERGTLSGRYMFDRMLAHFAAEGTAIDVIQGNWTYGVNLELFNRLSRVGLPPAHAAVGTITGRWAANHGYTTPTDIAVEPAVAPPGGYAKVTAKFRR
jgi:hypothetical protein